MKPGPEPNFWCGVLFGLLIVTPTWFALWWMLWP